jgi:uncharacterized surface protein with fasciclin (FAS1) repeats
MSVLPLSTKAQEKNIIQLICDTRPALKEALKQTGLTATLTGGGPYTFFAPSDKMLKKMMESNPGTMRDQLLNQIVAGRLTTDDLKDGSKLTALGGAQLSVFRKRNEIYINAVRISEANLLATDGILHIIEN